MHKAIRRILGQQLRRARAENTTLNELFRAWLERYVTQHSAADRYTALMESLEHIEAGRKFQREEM
ncbi:MAG: hypothetical protein EXR62_18455 [Chloroflexi bacterium]|nr:hypothetical protein [Chloroflexota bacterium]